MVPAIVNLFFVSTISIAFYSKYWLSFYQDLIRLYALNITRIPILFVITSTNILSILLLVRLLLGLYPAPKAKEQAS